MSGELGPFESVVVGIPVDPPDVGSAGGVAPVPVGVPVDAPVSGDIDPGIEGTWGGITMPILILLSMPLFTGGKGGVAEGLEGLPVISSQTGNINHG